jgi:UDP-glucose 4-epimerase
MRVLITGGAGFIGSHLADRLLASGHAVRVLDNLSTGKRTNLPDGHAGLEFIEGDIRDRDQVERSVRGAEAIVHLAAVASVQASVDDPLATHQTNFDGTLSLLEAARRHGVKRFLYASSAAVYGDTQALPVSEETPPRPLTPYAADKLAGEHYLGFYARQYELNATAFRFFNIYGPRQDPSSPYSGVISIFSDRLRAGKPVTVFGDGKQTRDFVYVGDLVDLLAAALARADLGGEVMNVGRGVECSLLELLAELERLAGRRIERTHAPARSGDIRHSRADVRRLREKLGKVPATPLGEGLARLLAAG